MRSLDHLGRGSEVKENKIIKEVKCDQPTDGQTKRVVESRARDLKGEGSMKRNERRRIWEKSRWEDKLRKRLLFLLFLRHLP